MSQPDRALPTAVGAGRPSGPKSDARPFETDVGLGEPSGVLFVDEGIVWRVRERVTDHDPGARASRCLLFISEGSVRRVWRYPADWAALASSALAVLCRQRY